MYCYPFFILALLCISVTDGKLCDSEDNACYTRIAKKAFATFMSGAATPGKSYDPLFEEKVVGEIPEPLLGYELTNITLVGLKNCPIQLSLNQNDKRFQFGMTCPILNLKSNYVAKGTFANIPIDLQGNFELTARAYEIKYNGLYEFVKDESDNKAHFIVKEYKIKQKDNGKITLLKNDVTKGSQAAGDLGLGYFNENWRDMALLLRSPTMKTLLTTFGDAFFNFVKGLPIEE